MPRRKPAPTQHDAEPIRLTDLKPHPRNYRRHPADQLAHIKHSLTEHGQYRNIVTADDLTVLAGHGVWLAATELGWETVRVVRLPIAADSPGALKILTGDNEIGLTAEIDDRLLTEILREIRDTAELVGTGYDDMMVANLLMVTRPASEIAGHDAAANWIGLPEHDESGPGNIKLVVSFDSEADREEFMVKIGKPTVQKNTIGTWSVRWPDRPLEDLASLRFAAG